MECELQKGGEGEGGREGLISGLEKEVKVATDQLLLTNFSACLETCRHVTAAVKSCEDCAPHIVDRLEKVQEAVMVIGIQALAEQGLWREVIPFVEQVYTHMAACPAPIMQMCLLLHSHVREYMVCHSLIDTWLDWDDHRHISGSGAIVTTYVTNVLVPLGAYNLIPQIVERCTALSSEERQALLSPRAPSSPQLDAGGVCSTSGHSTALEESDDASNSDQQACVGDDSGSKPKGLKVVTLYISVARKLWASLAKKGWCQQLFRASKLFFIISFVLLALLHVQTDVTAHFSRAMELWKMAVGALFSLWRQPPHKLL